MAILNDNRPLRLGHWSMSFLLISMEYAVIQLTVWMSSQKKRQIFLCSPSAAYSGAPGTTELTHICVLHLKKPQFSMCSHVNGIRSSLVSCQFPGLSSTLTCSCKFSTGPSGKPCPCIVCAAWTRWHPQCVQCLCDTFINATDL